MWRREATLVKIERRPVRSGTLDTAPLMYRFFLDFSTEIGIASLTEMAFDLVVYWELDRHAEREILCGKLVDA
jgi:hypothetical protein